MVRLRQYQMNKDKPPYINSVQISCNKFSNNEFQFGGRKVTLRLATVMLPTWTQIFLLRKKILKSQKMSANIFDVMVQMMSILFYLTWQQIVK